MKALKWHWNSELSKQIHTQSQVISDWKKIKMADEHKIKISSKALHKIRKLYEK